MSHKILTTHDITTFYMYIRMFDHNGNNDSNHLHNKILHKFL